MVESVETSTSASVTVAEVLELRAAALTEPETWSLLCQAAQALQDLFLVRKSSIRLEAPRVSPSSLRISRRGRVAIADDATPQEARCETPMGPTSAPDDVFLAPEYNRQELWVSDAQIEKMWIFSLGVTLRQAVLTSDRGQLSQSLEELLASMTERDPQRRSSLLDVLDVISDYCKSRPNESRPFSHVVMDLHQEVAATRATASPTNKCLRIDVDNTPIMDTGQLNVNSLPISSAAAPKSTAGVGKSCSMKETRPSRRHPVQRAPSRLYRAVSSIETKSHAKYTCPNTCIGPEFVVRASNPSKVIHMGEKKTKTSRKVTVILLNGQKLEIFCEPANTTAGQVYEVVLQVEKLEDNFTLGLAALLSGDFVFLSQDTRMCKIAPKGWQDTGKALPVSNLTLYLRVKFFLPSLRGVRKWATKHLMYLQLRRSLLEQQIRCEAAQHVLLGGLALQAEFGDFVAEEHGTGEYFIVDHYIPEALLGDDEAALRECLKQQHRARRGLDPGRAEEIYVGQAQQLNNYGSHFYSAKWITKQKPHKEVWIGVSGQGIFLYDKCAAGDRNLTEFYVWRSIQKLCYSKQYFLLHPSSDAKGIKPVKHKFLMDSNKSFFIFQLASLHHQFFMKLRIELSSLQSLSVEFGVPLRRFGKENKKLFIIEDNAASEESDESRTKVPYSRYDPAKRTGIVSLARDIINSSSPSPRLHSENTSPTYLEEIQNKENENPEIREKSASSHSWQLASSEETQSLPYTCVVAATDGDASSYKTTSYPRRLRVKMGTRAYLGTPRELFASNGVGELAPIASPTPTDSSLDSPLPEAYVLMSSIKSTDERFHLDFHETLSDSLIAKFENVSFADQRILRTLKLRRDNMMSLGIQITEGSDGGVYIQSITPHGSAARLGNIHRGDQLIAVDGHTLLNMKYQDALRLLQSTGIEVELVLSQRDSGDDQDLGDQHYPLCPHQNARRYSSGVDLLSEILQKPIEDSYLKNIRYETAVEIDGDGNDMVSSPIPVRDITTRGGADSQPAVAPPVPAPRTKKKNRLKSIGVTQNSNQPCELPKTSPPFENKFEIVLISTKLTCDSNANVSPRECRAAGASGTDQEGPESPDSGVYFMPAQSSLEKKFLRDIRNTYVSGEDEQSGAKITERFNYFLGDMFNEASDAQMSERHSSLGYNDDEATTLLPPGLIVSNPCDSRRISNENTSAVIHTQDCSSNLDRAIDGCQNGVHSCLTHSDDNNMNNNNNNNNNNNINYNNINVQSVNSVDGVSGFGDSDGIDERIGDDSGKTAGSDASHGPVRGNEEEVEKTAGKACEDQVSDTGDMMDGSTEEIRESREVEQSEDEMVNAGSSDEHSEAAATVAQLNMFGLFKAEPIELSDNDETEFEAHVTQIEDDEESNEEDVTEPDGGENMLQTRANEYEVTLEKFWGSIGIQIEDHPGIGLEDSWIQVCTVLPGGAAHEDGRISEGDRLLSINGQDARFFDQAVDLLRNSPDVVRLRLSHRRPSEGCRHDSSTGSPVSSRRSSKRRHQRRRSPLNAHMGSNVSRHSEKGLSGRRTQSSGNLCNGNKQLARDVGRILTSCSNVGPKDRNKFCGSLPNHLDGEYGDNELEEECCNNNNGDAYVTPRMNGDVPTSAAAALKNQKNGVELRLAPHHDTALQDQGYGSERSPEDEHLPPLPDPESFWALEHDYPFVTADASFEVTLTKGNSGLGLSVTGGVDTGEQWPGLIRIKRLFPHQPAWESGQLNTGDVLLAANGISLTGLTNYQALEVLRTTPINVVLAVCRPPGDVFSIAAPSEPPPPPRRDPALSVISSRLLTPLPLIMADEQYCGEFDITLTKVNRSLGFTLRKEDESVLGHYVRALVREPALSDGRIQPGDKIVAVNDMPMSPMTHEEAVSFLRQCGEHVKLRLYRDAAQTPVAALSPVDDGPAKPRPTLRQEAMDMLSDLAVRKLSPGNSSGSSQGLLRVGEPSSPGTSPRRRRLTKTPSPDIQAVALDRLGHRYLATSSAGGSDYSRDTSRNSTFVLSPREDCDDVDGDESRPERPKFLDLCSEAGNLSPGARKQRYVFAGSDTRSDDAWTLTSGSEDLTTIGSQCGPPGVETDGGLPTEPASLPPLSSNSSSSTAFSYRNPAYQSAHPACNTLKKPAEEEGNEHSSDQDIPGRVFEEEGDGSRGLMKWKGVMFAPENGVTENSVNKEPVDVTSNGQQEILTVELNRGWNSRLGFSLQGSNGHTYISAIYSDSVAAKDGRLQANDLLLTVNDENVEEMSTAEIIDLLRKIRGSIGIRVLRKSGPNLQVSS